MRTRLVALALTPLAVVALAACGGDSAGTSTPTAGTSAVGATTASGTSSSASSDALTMAEVATHNSTSSCWAAISGKVYDLTDWIGEHPGGPDRIEALCGTDATSAFDAQHGGQREPEERLAGFLLGDLTS
ncbi:MAG: cytochrome b5-like heme/steroid binding domain-containing protein [Dermatophilaceae bacterium]